MSVSRDPEVPVRRIEVDICAQCLRLEGESCNNPDCTFCRRGMAVVYNFLEALDMLEETGNAPLPPTPDSTLTVGHYRRDLVGRTVEAIQFQEDGDGYTWTVLTLDNGMVVQILDETPWIWVEPEAPTVRTVAEIETDQDVAGK